MGYYSTVDFSAKITDWAAFREALAFAWKNGDVNDKKHKREYEWAFWFDDTILELDEANQTVEIHSNFKAYEEDKFLAWIAPFVGGEAEYYSTGEDGEKFLAVIRGGKVHGCSEMMVDNRIYDQVKKFKDNLLEKLK